MKKFLSLLLALVMVLTCLSAMALAFSIPDDNDGTRRTDDAEKPADVTGCDESEAAIKLELGDGRVMYFKEMSSAAFKWAGWQNCDRTFIVLKDQEFKQNLSACEEWRNVPMTTIDLNGHTITAKSAIFYSSSFDAHLTIKNGTINFTGKTGFAKLGSTANFVTSDRYGWPCSQELIFDNVNVYMSESPYLVTNFQWGTKVVFKDSNVYTNGAGMINTKTNAADHAKYGFETWVGKYDCSVIIENSTVGCGDGALIKADDAIKVSVKDSTLVAASVLDAATGVLNAEGTKTENAAFSTTIAGNAVTGAAVTYATPAPVTPSVPTTGTPDVTTPATGVSVVALGVMAVVSLAGAVITKKH